VQAEVGVLRERLDDHSQIVQSCLAKKTKHTAAVLRLADGRIEAAEAQAKDQVSEVEQRSSETVSLVRDELDLTKQLAHGRVTKAVDSLMTFLEDESRPSSRAGLSLELWIPLPGSPDNQLALPGTPHQLCD